MPKVKIHVDVQHAGLRDIQQRIADWARRKGWLVDGVKRNPSELLMLTVTELAECCEGMRSGDPPCEKHGMEMFSNSEEELADVMIRVLQMAEEHELDVVGAMQAKMEFNEGRPYKHGKEF